MPAVRRRDAIMNDPSSSALLEGCVAAARAAGRHAMDHASRRGERVDVAAHDVKLALDVEAQAAAAAVIERMFPGHALLGEERGLRGEGEHRWVIDPIDGTVNFSHGVPYWAVSVAAQRRGRTVAGAIWLPMLDEMYTATDGDAARLNGRPIRVSETSRLADSMIYTGMVENDGDNGVSMRVSMRLAAAAQKLRILGSAAAELCYVAAGRGDGYVETTIHLWDVAAGALLVERAGGRCETLSRLGDHAMRFMATNGRIHEEARAAILSAITPLAGGVDRQGAPG